MARPKAFDREAALDVAMDLFWTHGYAAISMSDLQRAMGIGRQSLYDTFGDRRQVFQEVLKHYLEGMAEYSGALLGGEDGLAAIRAYFDTLVRDKTTGTVRRACLLFNTCGEVAPHDPEIKKQVRKGVVALQKRFELALGRAQEQGTLALTADVHSLAIFLATQSGGIVLLSKGGSTRKELRAAVDIALSAVK